MENISVFWIKRGDLDVINFLTIKKDLRIKKVEHLLLDLILKIKILSTVVQRVKKLRYSLASANFG